MDSDIQKMTTAEIETYNPFAVLNDDDDAQSRDKNPPEHECYMAGFEQVGDPSGSGA